MSNNALTVDLVGDVTLLHWLDVARPVLGYASLSLSLSVHLTQSAMRPAKSDTQTPQTKEKFSTIDSRCD